MFRNNDCMLCVDPRQLEKEGWTKGWLWWLANCLLNSLNLWVLTFLILGFVCWGTGIAGKVAFWCATGVAALWLVRNLGDFYRKRVVGTYLYYFQMDEVWHCHKHSYGDPDLDAQRRTLGATRWLQLAVGGVRKRSRILGADGYISDWIVKARGVSHVDLVSRCDGAFSLGNLVFYEALEINALGSVPQMAATALLETVRLREAYKAEDSLRAKEREIDKTISELRIMTGLRLKALIQLVRLVDIALKSRRGHRRPEVVQAMLRAVEDFVSPQEMAEDERSFLQRYLRDPRNELEDETRTTLLALLGEPAVIFLNHEAEIEPASAVPEPPAPAAP